MYLSLASSTVLKCSHEDEKNTHAWLQATKGQEIAVQRLLVIQEGL